MPRLACNPARATGSQNARTLLCLGLAALSFCAAAQQPDALQTSRDLMRRRQFQQARPGLEAYVHDHPESADAHSLLGFLLYSLQDPLHSLEQYHQAELLRPPRPNDLMAIAADYVLLNDFREAEKFLTQLTQQQPQNATAWYYLGRSLYSQSKYEAAGTAYRKALILSPHDVGAETNLGLVFETENDDEHALACYANAIDWQKDALSKNSDPYLFRGTLLVKQNHLDQALPLLLQAEQLGPSNPAVHEQLGRLYEAQDHHQQAQAEAERAIGLAPEAPSLHMLLGKIYRAEGMTEAAKIQLNLAGKLSHPAARKTPQ